MSSQDKLRVALVIALVSTFTCARLAAAQTSTRLDVKVRSSPKDRLTLEVSVTLRGDRPVRTSEFELPWGSTQSLVLMTGELPGGWPVPRAVQPIQDPGPVSFTLQPGRTITGTIDLRERFPDLVKTLWDQAAT